MFIIYTNNDEVIVCTSETEPKTLKLWFEEGGRDVNDYDRRTSNEEAVGIFDIIKVIE